MVLNHSCVHGWMHVRVIIFSLVRFFYKKNNQTEIKKTETGSNQPVSVQFGF